MLEFSDHVQWLGEMDSSEIEGAAGRREAERQSRGETKVKTVERQARSMEGQAAGSTEAGEAKTLRRERRRG